MSITAKPLGLQSHLMNRSIGHNPLGKRSPLGMFSDWIQTFPVLQLSLEQYDLLSQNASTYNESDFSTAERSTSKEPQQHSISTDAESQSLQAKEASESLVVPDAKTVTAPTQITEILSSQINRLPLAPPEPLGSRPVVDVVSQRSTAINPDGSDLETPRVDHSSFLESIEPSIETTPSESVEHSTSDLLSPSEDTNFVGELPTPSIQLLAQTGVESDVLPLSTSSSEVEAGKLSALEEDSVSDDVAPPIQLDREPSSPAPIVPIEAITATVTQPISEVVQSELTIGAKPNHEETASSEANSLDTGVRSDRASVSDHLVSPKASNDTISSSIEPPHTNSKDEHDAIDNNSNNASNRSAEINLKPNFSTPVSAPLSQITNAEVVPEITPNKQIAIQSAQLISPSKPPSPPQDTASSVSLDSSEKSSETVVQPIGRQSSFSEEATESVSPTIETLPKIEPVEPSSSDKEATESVSPAIETLPKIEPVELTTDTTPKINQSTVSEPTIDQVETRQPADVPTKESSSHLTIAPIETPINLSSNIDSEEPAIAEPIQTKLENIQTDNKDIITKQNDREIDQTQENEATLQTLPPLGMTQPLAPDRMITPPTIEPSQESLSQAQKAEQPLSEIDSLARSPADPIQDSPSIKESSKTDEPSDSWSNISDLSNQSSTKHSEEKSTASQDRSWQDVTASLTDISEAPTIQRDLQKFIEADHSVDAMPEIASSETMIHLRSLEQDQPEAIAPTSPQPTSPKKSTTDDEQLEQLAWIVYHQLRQRLTLDCERQGQLTHHPPWIEVIIPTSPKATQSSTSDQSITNTVEMLSPTNAKLSQLTGEIYYRVRSRLEVDRERYGRTITKI